MTNHQNQVFSVYFAGELFSDKHLIGNAMMAEAIERLSDGRYRCILPQCLEQREVAPEYIRNQDIRELLRSDLALFNFEGLELDSGTVVEFMFAKFLDIPSVVLRSDFRLAGDSGEYSWNLMAGYYPRTEYIIRDSLGEFKSQLKAEMNTVTQSANALEAVTNSIEKLCSEIVSSFDKVMASQPRIPQRDREVIYNWIRSMPGDSFANLVSTDEVNEVLERKVGLKLL